MFANNTNNNATNANGANANTTNNNNKLTAMLSALLHAARTASAFVRDALLAAADRIRQLVTPTTAPAPTTSSATTASTTAPMATTSSLNDNNGTGAPMAPLSPSAATTELPTAATISTTPGVCATATSTATATATTPTAALTAPRMATRATARATQATRMTARTAVSTTTTARRSTTTSTAGSQYHASATSSICETMSAIVTEAKASGTPLPSTTPSVQMPDVMPVFDELLLPLAGQPRTAAARAIRYRLFEHNVDFRATLAQRRIEVATMMRETPSPNFVQDPAAFVCGCGFCPHGTAAYPLCAAVTIRRTIRSFGSRATTSHAATFVRRQHACGRYDPAAVVVGRTRS